jgi:hypothetical protein
LLKEYPANAVLQENYQRILEVANPAPTPATPQELPAK